MEKGGTLKKHSVTIMPDNVTVLVPEDTSLLIASREAGIDITGTCGGRGTCGKCVVKIISGEAEINLSSHISKDLKEKGFILSCQAKVKSDIIIEVPNFSRLTKHKVELAGKGKRLSRESGYFLENRMNPICRKVHVKLDSPDLSDSLNDLDRVRSCLLKAYNIKNAGINLECLRRLPFILRESDWEVTLTLVNVRGVPEIVNIEAGKSSKPACGLAVDIGTTTVAVNLVNTENGEIIDNAGSYNRQAIYGSDVISRIVYSEETPDGLELLQKAVVDTINELVSGLLKKHGLDRRDIPVMVCAGNTVMSHLLLKIPADYLRREPYVPGAVKFPAVRAKELGIGINPEGFVVLLPSVASYVGGDITAGVLAIMLSRSERLTLFIDVGTNGELVLGNSDWMVTCSCSAGPAFEGSGISCGMRAMEGAIDWLEIDRDSLDAKVRVIGEVKPLGICGSGLIYAVAEMMRAGIIDRAGKIRENITSNRIRKNENGIEYLLVSKEESGSDRDIAIAENDVKNLLRAKAAMFAGIRTMLQEVQLDINSIEKVYIAGGFGNYINIIDAINIGLLPDLPEKKFEYIGNSSIQGAVIVLLCQEAMKEAEELADRMTNLELSVGNKFMDEFISALFIPHTDLSLFASVKN